MTKRETIEHFCKRIKEQNDYCMTKHGEMQDAEYLDDSRAKERAWEVYWSAMAVMERLITDFRNFCLNEFNNA